LVKFKKDQVIYISSAAGPVGSLLAFLARREGVHVIGSDEKVQYLTILVSTPPSTTRPKMPEQSFPVLLQVDLISNSTS